MSKKVITNTKTAPKKIILNNSRPSFIERNALKIAIALALIALCIRLYRIGYLSLWVDEYMHAIAAIHGKFKHGENNGILLTWFNTTFAFIFGNTEFSMRFPVALLGACLIPAVYVLGKNLMNYKVGLMAAILATFSLFLIYWSRVDRPYGMVATFYIPLLVCFWLMVEKIDKNSNTFLSKIGVNKKYFLWLPLALLLAMLSQLICFLFLFTAGFYGTFVAIESWIKKTSTPFKLNIYNILFYLNVLAIILMFTPLSNVLMRPIIQIFLPGNMANLILPDMSVALAKFSSKDMSMSFDKYLNVATADYKIIPILGWLGFILALIKNRKVGYFLIASYVVPILLMGFIFREPAHAKYLSYIYPVFLISAAYSCYFIAFYALPYLNNGMNTKSKSFVLACNLSFIALVFIGMKSKEIKSMLTTEKHGKVVSDSISEIPFVNWNQPCLYVKERMKSGDLIMATVQDAPKFYLKQDSVIWFRQMHMDGKTKTYVPNNPEKKKNSAYTFEQLVKTYENNPRGWLLADYYFDGPLTDPKAKQFVEQNFTFHFDACNDGAVKVFSWDKAKPKKNPTEFLIELGKNEYQQASEELTFNMNLASMQPKVTLVFLAQGIDVDGEAIVVVNGKQAVIQPNNKPVEEGTCIAQFDASAFVNGPNKIQFGYNPDAGDAIKGFVIMNMNVQ